MRPGNNNDNERRMSGRFFFYSLHLLKEICGSDVAGAAGGHVDGDRGLRQARIGGEAGAAARLAAPATCTGLTAAVSVRGRVCGRVSGRDGGVALILTASRAGVKHDGPGGQTGRGPRPPRGTDVGRTGGSPARRARERMNSNITRTGRGENAREDASPLSVDTRARYYCSSSPLTYTFPFSIRSSSFRKLSTSSSSPSTMISVVASSSLVTIFTSIFSTRPDLDQ